MAADTPDGPRTRRNTATAEQLVREPPLGYRGRHRLVSGDDKVTMPDGFWFRLHIVDPSTVTQYLPRIGELDETPAIPPVKVNEEHEEEQAAALQALRQRTPPDETLFQRILDGLRRL
jgi:hypothetical protein